MLTMTLGIVFFFIGCFKSDKRFFKAIWGCVLFDVIFGAFYAVEFFVFPRLVENFLG